MARRSFPTLGDMHTLFAPSIPVARQASRAIGAMFFCVFGGAWLGLWAHDTFALPLVAYALIGAATLVLFWLAFRVYKVHAPALKAEPESQEKRRRSRGFHLVNAGQWVVLVVVAQVLVNIGLTAWIIPAAIFIVGAHFLPLAKVFEDPPHYVTGVAMMLLAAVYPWVASAGANSPAGCLGAGVILWSSAAWAITRTRSQDVRRQASRGEA
jgi:hypothetical protein